ncbi:catalase [Ascidiaceihabitans sp.]|uniref:catalase n=1 Tax=Ascidiaceihabitans sp. TaxID=1872644 RepID=UPI003299F914
MYRTRYNRSQSKTTLGNTMPTSQATTLIDALNDTFGSHSGVRASHAKGINVRGSFSPAVETGEIVIPALQHPQPLTARFSIGGGKPGISDKSPTVRGMGLSIGTDKYSWRLAMISAPVFFANSAEQFRAFLAARKPDPDIGGPDPERVKAFNANNPNTLPHQKHLAETAPCRCYTTERYHSGHAYRFGAKAAVFARLLLEPVSGRHGLTQAEMGARSDSFLADQLEQTLGMGAARWDLKLIHANAQDNTQDPTEPWSSPHSETLLGTIAIEAVSVSGDDMVYDPAVLPEGVSAPTDAVFTLRSPAYSESYYRRAAS